LAAVASRRERKVCSWATTAAPSPMAAPTRFTEPERTSPTAKIPSTPVSSGNRTRSVEPTSAPVRMKPLSSRGMPQPASQPAVGEVEDVYWIRARALGSAVQPLDLGGEAELHPELLRLGESARHQRLPRDTGGKAQIILDARAGAGLSAKGVRFQDQDREAL